MMQIQYAKNLNPGRFVLSTTLSWPIWFIVNFPGKPGFKIDTFLTPMGTNILPDSCSCVTVISLSVERVDQASMFHIN